jgi:hypothetical protein
MKAKGKRSAERRISLMFHAKQVNVVGGPAFAAALQPAAFTTDFITDSAQPAAARPRLNSKPLLSLNWWVSINGILSLRP